MTLRLHNTLTRQIESFAPIEPGHVRMYVCGITIYDLCHVGHARMMVAFDLVYRWLRTLGYRVTYVRNITDIDDKIIRRAVERGITLRALTEEMVGAMHADLDALGVARPTHEPRATEYVPQMLAMIGTLEGKGLAYRSSSGDVNYAVRKFPRYGALSGKSIDELRAGERVAVLDGKLDPLDFVLWKAAKPDEPADAKYESPYGMGRPGWHIECSAMACALLGEHFDLHGGGADLQFPHHDNEIAQSEGASGRPPAAVWLHNGLLNVDNTKMSKSLGNFFTIREVLARYDALRRLYTALQGAPIQHVAIDWQAPHAAAFRAAMNDDLNTPGAVAVLFELAGEANRQVAHAADLLRALGGTLGLLGQDAQTFLRGGAAIDAAHVEARIAARAAAKRSRDFALADGIRKELTNLGVVLNDSPRGTTWTRA